MGEINILNHIFFIVSFLNSTITITVILSSLFKWLCLHSWEKMALQKNPKVLRLYSPSLSEDKKKAFYANCVSKYMQTHSGEFSFPAGLYVVEALSNHQYNFSVGGQRHVWLYFCSFWWKKSNSVSFTVCCFMCNSKQMLLLCILKLCSYSPTTNNSTL